MGPAGGRRLGPQVAVLEGGAQAAGRTRRRRRRRRGGTEEKAEPSHGVRKNKQTLISKFYLITI